MYHITGSSLLIVFHFRKGQYNKGRQDLTATWIFCQTMTFKGLQGVKSNSALSYMDI